MTKDTASGLDSFEHVAAPTSGPKGFCWLLPGLLAGTAQPGLNQNINRDLAALQNVNTGLLISLTAEWQPDTKLIAQFGIESFYAPIADQHPPKLEQAAIICAKAHEQNARGAAVVFHCRAGQGRTGTLLAAMLIWSGQNADQALGNIKTCNKNWIESDSQLAFLPKFAKFCRQNRI